MSKVLKVTWRRVFSKWRLCIIRNYGPLEYADLELVIHNGHKEIHRSHVLYKDKDKVIESSDVVTQNRLNYWQLPKFDSMGMYY